MLCGISLSKERQKQIEEEEFQNVELKTFMYHVEEGWVEYKQDLRTRHFTILKCTWKFSYTK